MTSSSSCTSSHNLCSPECLPALRVSIPTTVYFYTISIPACVLTLSHPKDVLSLSLGVHDDVTAFLRLVHIIFAVLLAQIVWGEVKS